MEDWLEQLFADLSKGEKTEVLFKKYKQLNGDVGMLNKIKAVGMLRSKPGYDTDKAISSVLGEDFKKKYLKQVTPSAPTTTATAVAEPPKKLTQADFGGDPFEKAVGVKRTTPTGTTTAVAAPVDFKIDPQLKKQLQETYGEKQPVNIPGMVENGKLLNPAKPAPTETVESPYGKLQVDPRIEAEAEASNAPAKEFANRTVAKTIWNGSQYITVPYDFDEHSPSWGLGNLQDFQKTDFKQGDIRKTKKSPTGYEVFRYDREKGAWTWTAIVKPATISGWNEEVTVKAIRPKVSKEQAETVMSEKTKNDKPLKDFIDLSESDILKQKLAGNPTLADAVSQEINKNPTKAKTGDGRFEVYNNAIAKNYKMDVDPFHAFPTVDPPEFNKFIKQVKDFEKVKALSAQAKNLAAKYVVNKSPKTLAEYNAIVDKMQEYKPLLDFFARKDVSDMLHLMALQSDGEKEMASALNYFPGYRERVNEKENKRLEEEGAASGAGKSFAKGTLDMLAGIGYSLSKFDPFTFGLVDIRPEEVDKMTDKYYDNYKQWSDATFQTGVAKNDFLSFVNSALQTAPQVIAIMLTKNPALGQALFMAAPAYAESVHDSYTQGLSKGAAHLKGIVDAAIEVGTEQIVNDHALAKGFKPSKALSELGLKSFGTKEFNTLFRKEVSEYIASRPYRLLKDYGGQMTEEVSANLLHNMANSVANALSGSKFETSQTGEEEKNLAGSMALITLGMRTIGRNWQGARAQGYRDIILKNAVTDFDGAMAHVEAMKNNPDIDPRLVQKIENDLTKLATLKFSKNSTPEQQVVLMDEMAKLKELQDEKEYTEKALHEPIDEKIKEQQTKITNILGSPKLAKEMYDKGVQSALDDLHKNGNKHGGVYADAAQKLTGKTMEDWWKEKVNAVNDRDDLTPEEKEVEKDKIMQEHGKWLVARHTEKGTEVFTDFDDTVSKDGKLTPLGEELKKRAAAGEKITVLTAREDTPANRKYIADQLGIPEDQVKLGLDAKGKAALLTEGSTYYNENAEELEAGRGVQGVKVVDTKIGATPVEIKEGQEKVAPVEVKPAPVVEQKPAPVEEKPPATEEETETEEPDQDRPGVASETFTGKNLTKINEIAAKHPEWKARKLYKNAANAIKVWSKLMPNMAVTLHHSKEEFAKEVLTDPNATQEDAYGSRGFYVSSQGIHINVPAVLERGVADEVFHEAGHPLLDMILKNNPAALDKHFEELVGLEDVLPGVTRAIDFGVAGDAYEGAQKKKEAIVQFITMVADREIVLDDLSPSALDRVTDFIKRFLNSIGFDYQLKVGVNQSDSLVDVARKFSHAINKGKALQFNPKEIKSDGETIAVNATMPEEKQWAKGVVIKPTRTDVETVDRKTLSGKDITVIPSDRLHTGEAVNEESGKIHTAFGGIFYNKATGRVWASANKTGANNILKSLRFDKDGNAFIGIMMMGDDSHMSNKNVFQYSLDSVEAAVKKNRVSDAAVVEKINKALRTASVTKALKSENLVKGNAKKAISQLNNIFDDASFNARREFLEAFLGKTIVEGKKSGWGGLPTFNEVSDRLSEPAVKDVPNGHIVAYIKVSDDIKLKETTAEDKQFHISYPVALEAGSTDFYLLNESIPLPTLAPKMKALNGNVLDWNKYTKKYGEEEGLQRFSRQVILHPKTVTAPQFSKGEGKKGRDVFIQAAPYYDTKIKKLSDAKALRESGGYKEHIAVIKNIADVLGIKVSAIDETIGGFLNDEGNKIREVSNRVQLDTGDMDKAEQLAALIGALTHQTQESTIASKYVRLGSADQSAIETEIKVSDLEKAITALEKVGINGFEANESDGTIKVLDFKNGTDLEFATKMSSFADELDKNSVTYEARDRAIQSRYIDPQRRTELLKEAQLKIDQRQSGAIIRDLYEQAITRSEQFQQDKQQHSKGTADGRAGQNRGRNRSYFALPEDTKRKFQKAVTDYTDKNRDRFNIPADTQTEVVLDEAFAKTISDQYDKLPDDDSKNSEVAEAYSKMAEEVEAQYEYLTKELGIKVEFSNDDPYPNSEAMTSDVVNNKHLFAYKGGEDHPFLGQKTLDKNGITTNEKFRAVHDYFGHAVEGNQFGKHGEERAWVAHSKMFSPQAQRALSTETRGQNAWVNSSGINTVALEKINNGNKLIKEGKIEEGEALRKEGQAEFKFAIQKVALLPANFTDWTVYATKQKKVTLYHAGYKANAIEGLKPDHRGIVWFSTDPKQYGANKITTPKTVINIPAKDLLVIEGVDGVTTKEGQGVIDATKHGTKEEIFKEAMKRGYKAVQRSFDVAVDPEYAKQFIEPVDERQFSKGTSKKRDPVLQAHLDNIKALVKADLKGKNATNTQKVKEVKAIIADKIKQMVNDGIERKVFKGDVKASLLASVIKRLNATESPYSMLQFIDYLGKMMDNVEYEGDLQQANKIRKNIKNAIKSKVRDADKLTKDMVEAFVRIKPSNVSDIHDYIAIANRVLTAATGIKVRSAATGVSVKNPFVEISHKELTDYTQEQQELADEQAAQRIADMHQELVDNDVIDVKAMTAKEMIDIIKSISGEDEKAIADAKQQIAEDKDNKMNALKAVADYQRHALMEIVQDNDVPLTNKERETVRRLLKIDLEKLTGIQLAKYIDVVNNILVNNNFVGAGDIAIQSKMREDAEVLRGKLKGMGVKMHEITNWAVKSLSSQALFYGFLTKLDTAAAEVQRLIGISGVQSGNARARDIQLKAVAGYDKLKKGMSSDIDSALNKYRRGVYADVMNNFGGTKAEQDAEFLRRVKWIKESARLLRESSIDREQREAILLDHIIDELLNGSQTQDDVKTKMQVIEPDNIRLVKYWQDTYRNRWDAVKENAEIFNNRTTEDVDNYTATMLKGVDNRGEQTDREIDINTQTFISQNLKLNPAGTKIAKVRSEKPPPDRVLNLDFDYVQSKKFFETNYDVETAEHILQAKAFLESDMATELLGGSGNVKLVRRNLQKSIALQRGQVLHTGDEDITKGIKFLTDWVHRKSTRLALLSLVQWGKQYLSILPNTILNLGVQNLDLLAKAYSFSVNDELYDLYNISQRGATRAGFTKMVQPAEIEQAFLGNTPLKVLREINKKSEVVTDMLAKSLVKGDVRIARRSWAAFYMLSLRKQGIDISSRDMSQEHLHPNDQAAAYAEQMVSKNQNPNDPSSMANLHRQSNDQWWDMIKNVALPFSTFPMNMRMRMTNDVQKLIYGTPKGRWEAGRSLLATTVEQFIFNYFKVYWIGQASTWAAAQLANAMGLHGGAGGGDDEDKKDKEEEEKLRKRWLANSISDIFFSGMGTGIQTGFQEGANMLNQLINPPKKEFSVEKNKLVKVYTDDWYYMPNKKLLDYLGIYGIAPKKIIESWKDGTMAFTGETEKYLERSYGDHPQTENIALTEKEQWVMIYLFCADALGLAGLSDAEVKVMNSRLRKTTKDQLAERAGKHIENTDLYIPPKKQ